MRDDARDDRCASNDRRLASAPPACVRGDRCACTTRAGRLAPVFSATFSRAVPGQGGTAGAVPIISAGNQRSERCKEKEATAAFTLVEKKNPESLPPSHPDTHTLFASVFVLCQKRVICGVTMKDFFKMEITFFFKADMEGTAYPGRCARSVVDLL